jgi:hypothetical protein
MFNNNFMSRSLEPRLEERLAAISLAAATAATLTMNALPLLPI